MTCRHCSKPHSTPTDILTYRYNGKMIYVPAAPDYNHALSHVRDAFPQLKDTRDASLSLSLFVPPKFVGISAPAWPKLLAQMTRYQIIDVRVMKGHERNGPGADEGEETEPAPPYPVGVSDAVVDDGQASHPRPQSPSASTSEPQPKRSWIHQVLHGQ